MRYPPGTVGRAFEETARRLGEVAGDGARLDARLLVSEALGKAPEYVIGYPERIMPDEASGRLAVFLDQRLAHKPISQILGRREFRSLDFEVTAATLTPRPETEILVEMCLDALRDVPSPRVLDLGSGTGCILLSLMSERRDILGLGVDESEGALEVARRNAERLGCDADFRRSDWFGGVQGAFDLIVSNPPYIPAGEREELPADVRDHEPAAALFAGDDGLDAYRAIARGAGAHLKSGGDVAVEVGMGRVEDVASVFERRGFRRRESRNDLAGRARALWFVRGK